MVAPIDGFSRKPSSHDRAMAMVAEMHDKAFRYLITSPERAAAFVANKDKVLDAALDVTPAAIRLMGATVRESGNSRLAIQLGALMVAEAADVVIRAALGEQEDSHGA